MLTKIKTIHVVHYSRCSASRRKPQKKKIISDVKCPKCQEIESPMHIFFFCLFTKQVWLNIPLKYVVHIATDDTFDATVVRFRQQSAFHQMVSLIPSSLRYVGLYRKITTLSSSKQRHHKRKK